MVFFLTEIPRQFAGNRGKLHFLLRFAPLMPKRSICKASAICSKSQQIAANRKIRFDLQNIGGHIPGCRDRSIFHFILKNVYSLACQGSLDYFVIFGDIKFKTMHQW